MIVGGNSILHGYGQNADQIWTRHLQELLGDRYCVLNLAMRGGFPAEFAGPIAEALSSRYPAG